MPELKLYAVTPIKDITIEGKSYKKGRVVGGIEANTLEEAQAKMKQPTFIFVKFIIEYSFGNVSEYSKVAVTLYSRLFQIAPDNVYFGSLGAQHIKPKVGGNTYNILSSDLKTKIATKGYERGFANLNVLPENRFYTTGLVYNSYFTNGKVNKVYYQVQNADKSIIGWTEKETVQLVKTWGDLVQTVSNVTVQNPLGVIREGVEFVQDKVENIFGAAKLVGALLLIYAITKK